MRHGPTSSEDAPAPNGISRRRFLTGAGAGALVLASDLPGWLVESVADAALDDVDGVLTVTLVRPADQLRIQFQFVNLAHDVAAGQLIGTGTGPALMRLILPRQHLAEAGVASGVTPPGAAGAPVDHRVAANSRLVFEATPPIDLTVASLLDLATYTLVRSSATGDPTDDQTMLEIPADLRLSPADDVFAVADVAPFTVAGVSQLHRIVLRSPEGVTLYPVHNRTTNDGFAGRIPSGGDRAAIVAAAGGSGLPANASRLWLTPHGAWADLDGDWGSIAWVQRIQGGRDQFAQTVTRGVLMPFGHPAVWTETATRLWLADADGDIVATLVTEVHFAVDTSTIEPVGAYSPNFGRAMPLRTVTVESRENSAVQKGTIEWGDPPTQIPTTQAWRVEYTGTYAGAAVQVTYSATDSADNPPVTFSLPAIFARLEALENTDLAERLAEYYDAPDTTNVRTARFRGDLAWAEPTVAGSGLSTLYTTSFELRLDPITGVDFSELLSVGQLPVAPAIGRGEVTRLELLPDRPDPSLLSIEVEFPDAYLEFGNDPAENPSEAFLRLIQPQKFPLGNEARAAMTPDMVAAEFNQTLGIGPEIDATLPGGTWNPIDAFGEAAQILGGVRLAELVAEVLLSAAVPGIDIPDFTFSELPDEIVQRYTWCPDSISSVPAAGFITSTQTRLCVEIETVISLDEVALPTSTIRFEVTDFTLVVPPVVGLVELDVAALRAVQPSNGAADLTFDVAQWRLGGILSWIEPLFDLLTPAGSDFDIDIDASKIALDLSLPAPNISLGVLSIKNFSIALGGDFPFDGSGQALIRFAIGARKAPVTVQIMQFTGGFWGELELSAKGLELLHLKAEVSAQLFTIDIVVAKAYCAVGIAAEFKLVGTDVTFIGELWVEASFSVLGLVGATVRVTGRVRYKSADETITISGTIHWSVTALFTYSGTVPIGSIDFQIGDGASGASGFRALPRQAAGTGAGSSFGDVHTFATWNDYVAKFAVEA